MLLRSVLSPATTTLYETSTSRTSDRATANILQVVFQHNLHRANHSAPNMTWGTGLATSAKIVAQSCNFAHNMTVNGGGYGQNIAAGIQSTNVSYIISDMFYNSEAPNFNGLYGQAQPSYANFGSWGHFSQVVWKASTKVACYTQYCPKGLKGVSQYVPPYFTVCNYKTPGGSKKDSRRCIDIC